MLVLFEKSDFYRRKKPENPDETSIFRSIRILNKTEKDQVFTVDMKKFQSIEK